MIRASCSLIGDIQINGCEKGLLSHLDQYAPLLLDHLKSTNVERTVKVRCISALAETCVLAKGKFDRHIEKTMSIFNSAAKRCVDADINQNEPEIYEYILQLQTALLEAYTMIIQGIDE